MNTDWFEALFGFVETSPQEVRRQLRYEGTQLRSLANGAVFEAGRLETPSLAELRQEAARVGTPGETSVEEWVIDAEALHRDARAAGSLVQVASQFNLLEMVAPEVTPEQGVTGYVYDYTQGPACALAAAAGTVYRAHLVELEGQRGQSADRQIDSLAGVEAALRVDEASLWAMRNGYALPSREQLGVVTRRIEEASEAERDTVRAALRVGLQWDTQVTLPGVEQVLTQAYCSALPVSYSEHGSEAWAPFGRLILEGAYEATLAAAVVNAARSGSRRVFLTLLGGGAFGNPTPWIVDAIARATHLHRNAGLEVVIASFRAPNPDVESLLSA